LIRHQYGVLVSKQKQKCRRKIFFLNEDLWHFKQNGL
jgi:hypothetical protein